MQDACTAGYTGTYSSSRELGESCHWIEEPRTSLLDGRPEKDRPRPRVPHRQLPSESVPTLGWV